MEMQELEILSDHSRKVSKIHARYLRTSSESSREQSGRPNSRTPGSRMMAVSSVNL